MATFGIVLGSGEVLSWVASGWLATWWGVDSARLLRTAHALLDGRPLYQDPANLYSPLAAVLAVPLTVVPYPSIVWDLISIAVLLCGVSIATRGIASWWRVVASLAAITFLPVIHDLGLGNINIAISAAMGLVLWRPGRASSGLPLGVALAVAPKPILVAFLAWMLVWRRGALVATVLSALALTAATTVVIGPEAELAWLRAIASVGRYAVPFAGNAGLTALAPTLAAPISVLAAAGYVVVLMKRSETVSLVWAVSIGLVVAPYAGQYAAVPLLLAVIPFSRIAPWRSIGLAALAPVGLLAFLPFFAMAVMAAALTADRAGTHSRESVGDASKADPAASLG